MNIRKILSTVILSIFVFTNMWLTDIYANFSDKIWTKYDIKTKHSQKEFNKLKNTISWKDDFKIVISSTKDLKDLKTKFKEENNNIKLKSLWNNLFQVKIPKNSNLWLW